MRVLIGQGWDEGQMNYWAGMWPSDLPYVDVNQIDSDVD